MGKNDIGFSPSGHRQRLAGSYRYRLHMIAGVFLEHRDDEIEQACILHTGRRRKDHFWLGWCGRLAEDDRCAGDHPDPDTGDEQSFHNSSTFFGKRSVATTVVSYCQQNIDNFSF